MQNKSISILQDGGKVWMLSLTPPTTPAPYLPYVGKPYFATRADFVKHARAICDQIGWEIGEIPFIDRALPTPNSAHEIHHTRLSVTFEPKVNGYESRGGNYVNVNLDSLNGGLVSLQRGFGYTYGPAIVSITADQALKIAQTASPKTKFDHVEPLRYYTISPNSKNSSRAQGACDEKQMLLAYWVKGQPSYMIAPDTGEILNDQGYTAALTLPQI